MAEGVNASTARRLFESILAVEEEHAEDLASLIAGDLSMERQSDK